MRVDPGREPQTLGRGLRLQHADAVLDQGGGAERSRVQLQRGGLELGEVQHVVDDRVQRLGGVVDHADPPPVLLAEAFALGEQPREADHAVQRRAQFVADVGEQVRLGPRRPLGRAPRLGQIVFLGLLHRHVADDVQEPVRRCTRMVAQGGWV